MKINPKRLCCALICVLFLSFRCAGQTSSLPELSAIPAQPPDLHLVLSTKEGHTQFHLGEIIDLDVGYSSSTPGKYLLVTLPSKIHGHSARLTVTPGQHVIDRSKDNGMRNIDPILHANCGTGFSGGVGSGCGDCDAELPLTSSPVHYPYSLTTQFQITEPGSYIVQAKSDDVIVAPLIVETSKPIQLTSNSVQIEVTDDPVWSEEELQKATTRFENARTKYVDGGWASISADSVKNSPGFEQIQLQFEMQGAVETMRVLDTEASLTKIVQLYNGVESNPDYYTHVLLEAIIQSKHRRLAIKLLSERIADPDFAVSKDLLDQLTAMELENQIPDAFSRDDDDFQRQLYPSARQILQEHILALGDSLQNKNAEAFASSLKTFKLYANEQFCTDEPLIPNATTRQMLKAVQAPDTQVAQ